MRQAVHQREHRTDRAELGPQAIGTALPQPSAAEVVSQASALMAPGG